jgi:glutamyl/glutaminyl-tRNA synthetase
MQPLRLALSGEGGGPPIFEMLHLIGVEESIARIHTAIQQIALTA